MITKKRVNSLLKQYGPKFTKALHIRTKIRWHVYHSTRDASRAEKYNLPIGIAGCNTQKIKGVVHAVIYYDNQPTETEVILSIFHELMHIKLTPIVGVRTSDKLYDKEEKLISALEDVLLLYL